MIRDETVAMSSEPSPEERTIGPCSDRRRACALRGPSARARRSERASRVALVALVALVATTASRALSAQPSTGPAVSTRIEATVRVSQARAAMRRGDEAEALRLLQESLRLHSTPEALREIALIYERRNERRLAADAWNRLAALGRTPTERAQAAERAALLRRAPSMLRVRVLPADAARRARVWFDRDVPRSVPVGGAETLVEGGLHRVRVESPGYEPFETMVTTLFGEALEVVARMQRVGVGDGDAGVRDGSWSPKHASEARRRGDGASKEPRRVERTTGHVTERTLEGRMNDMPCR
jgi:hypothetical protein